MAVIRVFDSVGVKTVQLMGNLNEQDYDDIDEMDETDDLINSLAEDTDDAF